MHCQPEIVRYLLDQAGATVEGLQPQYVYYATNWKGNGEEVRDENDGEMERVERTWELLLEEGWDVNSREKRGDGRDDGYGLLSSVLLSFGFFVLLSFCPSILLSFYPSVLILF